MVSAFFCALVRTMIPMVGRRRDDPVARCRVFEIDATGFVLSGRGGDEDGYKVR